MVAAVRRRSANNGAAIRTCSMSPSRNSCTTWGAIDSAFLLSFGTARSTSRRPTPYKREPCRGGVMHFVEGILIALDALWANKLRTVLTLLGNIVGVTSVIAVVSIIDGMNAYIRTEVASEGSGVFNVQQVNTLDILSDFDKFLKSLHNPDITLSDLEYLKERVTLAEYMDANESTSAQVRFERRYINSVTIQGRSDNYPMLGRYELKDGRHFFPQEVTHAAEVAVIGFDV